MARAYPDGAGAGTGFQIGLESLFFASVSVRTSPRASTTAIAPSPENAISLPSGDHAGSMSSPPPLVLCSILSVERVTTEMPKPPPEPDAKAIWRLSGDHEGAVTVPPRFVRRRGLVPFAFMTQSSVTGPPA